jgi:hypothetical protein
MLLGSAFRIELATIPIEIAAFLQMEFPYRPHLRNGTPSTFQRKTTPWPWAIPRLYQLPVYSGRRVCDLTSSPPRADEHPPRSWWLARRMPQADATGPYAGTAAAGPDRGAGGQHDLRSCRCTRAAVVCPGSDNPFVHGRRSAAIDPSNASSGRDMTLRALLIIVVLTAGLSWPAAAAIATGAGCLDFWP